MVYLNYILTLGEVTVKLLDLELQEVSDWFGLGLHLDIPPPELHNIKHNITLRSHRSLGQYGSRSDQSPPGLVL